MKRREFMALFGGAAAGWPFAARAQQAGKLPTIGFLGTASASNWVPYVAAFVQRLRELGWIEGRTVAVEYRWAEGQRYAEIIAEFIRLKVDLIVTGGGAVLALKQATSTIPIVFAVASDPLGSGMVASLSRPGGNVTGLSNQASDVAGKRIEVLREMLPGLHRIAILANLDYSADLLEMGQVEAAARTLGIEAVRLGVRRTEDIASAFETLGNRADALYVCVDPFLSTNRTRINALAQGARLPTVYGQRENAEAGGLISYGPNAPDLFRRAANYADKILRGAKPGDLPVEQPTKFELTINLKTAKALGLDVPPSLLARADEVFE
jgi:putative tryptophan/tyrosine transport system substrate-binding protein